MAAHQHPGQEDHHGSQARREGKEAQCHRQELDGQYEQRVDDRQGEANGRKFTCFCGEDDGEVDKAKKASKRGKEGDARSKTA